MKTASSRETNSGKASRACAVESAYCGRQHQEAERGRPIELDCESRAVRQLAAHRKAAKQRRRDVIGMTFQRASRVQQALLRQRTGHRLIETQARYRRRRAAAQAAAHGDLRAHLDMQRRERSAALPGSKMEGALNVVFAVDLAVGKFEMKLVLALDNGDGKIQIKLNSNGERVETWPQIGDGRGNANLASR